MEQLRGRFRVLADHEVSFTPFHKCFYPIPYDLFLDDLGHKIPDYCKLKRDFRVSLILPIGVEGKGGWIQGLGFRVYS